MARRPSPTILLGMAGISLALIYKGAHLVNDYLKALPVDAPHTTRTVDHDAGAALYPVSVTAPAQAQAVAAGGVQAAFAPKPPPDPPEPPEVDPKPINTEPPEPKPKPKKPQVNYGARIQRHLWIGGISAHGAFINGRYRRVGAALDELRFPHPAPEKEAVTPVLAAVADGRIVVRHLNGQTVTVTMNRK